MNSRLPNIEVSKNRVRGDLSVFVETHNTDELREVFRGVLREEASLVASSLIGDPMHPENQVMSGVFYAKEQHSVAVSAATDAVWAAASGDELLIYEFEPHRAALVEFLSTTPEFISDAGSIGRPLTVSELPRALRVWEDKCFDPAEASHIKYLRAVALFLGCQYGRALETIDLLARSQNNPALHAFAADCALNVGQYSVAMHHLDDALTFKFRDDLKPELRTALLVSNMGACHEALLESEMALIEYRRALDLLNENDGGMIENLIKALLLNNMGFSLMTIGNQSDFDDNLQNAEACFREALKIREESHDSVVNQATIIFNLAEVRRKLDDRAESGFLLDRAQGLLERLPTGHILQASIQNSRGKAYFDAERYDEALKCFREARATLAKHFGERCEQSVLTTYSIAQTLEAMGEPDAKKYLMHAKTLAYETLDDRHHPIIRMIEADLKTPLRRRFFRLQ